MQQRKGSPIRAHLGHPPSLAIRLGMRGRAACIARGTLQYVPQTTRRCLSTTTPMCAEPQAKEKPKQFDHRTIGQAQKLFFTHDSSPGTPFVLPHGVRISTKIERVIRDLYDKWGYHEVISPQLFKADLWKQSGHWENYRDDMFAVEGFKEVQERNAGCCGGSHDEAGAGAGTGEDGFGLKPMNCPGHCVMYASQEHSYRDLPIRYAEFSALHRNEPSGSLTGLTRVRRFHQDDAHVFCRPDQIASEIARMLEMLQTAYRTFGFPRFELVLSTRPTHYLGELSDWEKAENGLRQALQESGMKWKLNEADGAFYGPKIDIRLVDSAGKRHQTATIQLDFQLPSRFRLKYDDAQGHKAQPVMIHRAILGSMERFMAILIEHTRGIWPFWLSPRQAIVIPVHTQSTEMVEYAERVAKTLSAGDQDVGDSSARPGHFFHVDVDTSDETLSKRVRRAQVSKYNFVCIVGDEELQAGTVSVRARQGDEASSIPVSPKRPELSRDMGPWTVADLRGLFVTLDGNRW